MIKRGFIALWTALLALPLVAVAGLQQETLALARQWDHIHYQMAADDRAAAYEALATKAAAVAKAYPDAAEPRIWQAIALASLAGEKGGLSALGLVKRARKLLLAAERLNPEAMQGSVYVTLGSLYDQVPGWPISFGDRDKARAYLERALRIAPDSMGANYFMADFLIRHKQYAAARGYLQKVLAAPDLKQRPVYSKGRKAEARQALARVEAKLARR